MGGPWASRAGAGNRSLEGPARLELRAGREEAPRAQREPDAAPPFPTATGPPHTHPHHPARVLFPGPGRVPSVGVRSQPPTPSPFCMLRKT